MRRLLYQRRGRDNRARRRSGVPQVLKVLRFDDDAEELSGLEDKTQAAAARTLAGLSTPEEGVFLAPERGRACLA
jgi:hypothetical protein